MWLKSSVNLAILLALVVIPLGAYTRLTDAGLGCPDWPGCYGHMIVPQHQSQIDQSQSSFSGATFVPHKARNEMVHRYVAGLLGLSVLSVFILSLFYGQHRRLAMLLFLLVLFQAALGMWTVTLNLLPLVVMGHLLGGFSLLSLLVLLRFRIARVEPVAGEEQVGRLLPFAYIALFTLLVQIALGGWTSANYAALACHQLPVCESGWVERFSVRSVLSLPFNQKTYEYGVLNYDSRMSIHVMHRIGALVTLLILGSFAVVARHRSKSRIMKLLTSLLIFGLGLQFCLGLINVIAFVPLLNALAHNFVAANLLMLQVAVIYQLHLRQVGDYKHFTSMQVVGE